MIKLYDFKSSPNCQRVKVVLAEKNLPYEIVPIDLRAQEQKTPDYLKMNPYGKVPVLTDDAVAAIELLAGFRQTELGSWVFRFAHTDAARGTELELRKIPGLRPQPACRRQISFHRWIIPSVMAL